MQLFEKAADYQAFEQVLQDTLDQSPMRICAYAVMPNHWHLLLWPECDGELAAFMQRLTITQAFLGRVDLGGCPPRSPTDPGLHITRTRFLSYDFAALQQAVDHSRSG